MAGDGTVAEVGIADKADKVGASLQDDVTKASIEIARQHRLAMENWEGERIWVEILRGMRGEPLDEHLGMQLQALWLSLYVYSHQNGEGCVGLTTESLF